MRCPHDLRRLSQRLHRGHRIDPWSSIFWVMVPEQSSELNATLDALVSAFCRAARGRRSAQQSRREFASAVLGTRTGDAAISKSEGAAEVQLSSCPGAQPIQSGAPSRYEASLQAETLCRLGRVARSRGIDRRSRGGDRTAPTSPLTPPRGPLVKGLRVLAHPQGVVGEVCERQ